MEKYRMLRERVWSAAVAELTVPEAATPEQLGRVHVGEYVDRVSRGALGVEEVRRIGFPWSPELVERSRRSVGGTLAAGQAALEDGVAVNLAGGTHHAFADRGEGFCVFNDVAVATRDLQAGGRVRRVAILDLDVHQGNGTAAIFSGDPSVFTLSVHGESNFPFRKEKSDLDLPLADGTGDEKYLRAAREGLAAALATGPDIAFYIAGADPFEHDRLGRLSVSKSGLAERDRLVLSECARTRVPVAVVMSGGYAHDVSDTVDVHEETVRIAARHTRPWSNA
jgi:acetoin utilization deacetylase AcuC-like enzyme